MPVRTTLVELVQPYIVQPLHRRETIAQAQMAGVVLQLFAHEPDHVHGTAQTALLFFLGARRRGADKETGAAPWLHHALGRQFIEDIDDGVLGTAVPCRHLADRRQPAPGRCRPSAIWRRISWTSVLVRVVSHDDGSPARLAGLWVENMKILAAMQRDCLGYSSLAVGHNCTHTQWYTLVILPALERAAPQRPFPALYRQPVRQTHAQ
jgi:hypothetical protein